MPDARPARVRPLFLAWAVFIVALFPSPALAAWPDLGRALGAAPGDQGSPRVAPDGAGGAIVTWQDLGAGVVDIFAQHVLATGELDPAWPANGRALLTDPQALATAAAGQQAPEIVADGAGGAIVAWQDGRSLTSGFDIYAQHVLATGAVDPAWPANGRLLCGTLGAQFGATIASDGAGGAIVAWQDIGVGFSGHQIFAQHVLASGALDAGWPVNGAAVCTALADQEIPRIASDGLGGAFVTWFDFRPAPSEIDIYAQHMLGSGAADPAWPVDGVAVCSAAGNQFDPSIIPDGAHGAIIAWHDLRAGSGSDIYAQRLTVSGAIAPGWPANGIALCAASGDQGLAYLVPDGASPSGAIATWQDGRSDHFNMYAQHVSSAGVVDAAWPVDGRALSVTASDQTHGAIAPDGAGGAIVAWQDGFDIIAQHVLASGALDAAFPASGRPVSDLPGTEQDPVIVAAGPGAAIVTWADSRSGAGIDIYAQQVLASGTTGVGPRPAPGISFSLPSPNPARGSVTLRFALPRESGAKLAVFDAGGRRVRNLVAGRQGAGEHSLAWDLRDDAGRATPAGLYFAQLDVEGIVLSQKILQLHE